MHTERRIVAPYELRDEDVLYFFHLPKTGGISFTSFLESRFPAGQTCPARVFYDLYQLPPESLSRYRLYCGHFGFNLARLDPRPMITFTLLRDPVERFISTYHNVKR